MKYQCLALYLFLGLLQACQENEDGILKRNKNGEVTYQPYHWKKSIHVDGAQNYVGIIFGNLVFGDRVIISVSDGPEKRDLTMVDIKDGRELWKWNESFQPDTESPNFDHYVIYGDILHWIKGSRHYAINTNTGTTLWKDRKDVSFPSFVEMIGDTVLFTGPTSDTLPGAKSTSGYKRSIFDPDCWQFLHPHFRLDTGGVGNLLTSIYRIYPLSGILNNKLLVITSQPYDNWFYAPEINLFDINAQSWVYHSKPMVSPKQNNAGNSSAIYNDRFYFSAGLEIMCHDIATGAQLWRKQFPADFLFSGFIISDGVLVANCEDQVLYGINPENGNILWKGSGSGTSSPLKDRALNGVVYFSGGSPNAIFAVDINTGMTLWALEASAYEHSGQWKGDIYVIPGQGENKGRIIACTMMNCYCFDAAR